MSRHADANVARVAHRLLPFFFFGATALFALGTWIKARLRHRARLAGRGWAGLSLFLQFLLALYGGYFGAAMGFMLLFGVGAACEEYQEHENQ